MSEAMSFSNEVALEEWAVLQEGTEEEWLLDAGYEVVLDDLWDPKELHDEHVYDFYAKHYEECPPVEAHVDAYYEQYGIPL